MSLFPFLHSTYHCLILSCLLICFPGLFVCGCVSMSTDKKCKLPKNKDLFYFVHFLSHRKSLAGSDWMNACMHFRMEISVSVFPNICFPSTHPKMCGFRVCQFPVYYNLVRFLHGMEWGALSRNWKIIQGIHNISPTMAVSWYTQ